MEDLFKISILNKEFVIPNQDSFLKKLNEESKSKGRHFSNLTGYQSEDLNLNDLLYKPFLNGVLEHAKNYAKLLKVNTNLAVGNFWLNINNFKDSNSPHYHPGSIFSGVYYVNVPKNSGNIVFQNSLSNYLDLFWPDEVIENYNNYTSSEFQVLPVVNHLIIFPSWLQHYVKPNLSKEPRVSISFNVGRAYNE